jgi:uncharacterized protein (TIGR03083 family)
VVSVRSLDVVDPGLVLAVHLDGVEALAGFGSTAPPELWSQQVCGMWTGGELAGHVLQVSRWYHQWLDRAQAGESDPPFPAKQLATQNQQALNSLPLSSGPDRLATFRRSATEYTVRLESTWDRPYGFPFGTVTAGQHAALGAMEWHAHAWDLARASGGDHRPVDPDALAAAVVDAWSARHGPVRRVMNRGASPVVRRALRDPWPFLLRNTGRHPT